MLILIILKYTLKRRKDNNKIMSPISQINNSNDLHNNYVYLNIISNDDIDDLQILKPGKLKRQIADLKAYNITRHNEFISLYSNNFESDFKSDFVLIKN